MIAFVLAMRDEAQPLIEHLGLQRCKRKTLFPVYYTGDSWLTISGVGKTNAAAAVTELHHVTGLARAGVWLNVGIAGHGDLSLGTLRSAHRITDAASEQRWYPPQVLLHDVASCALVSVDKPETDYPEDCLYDMESAGFYPAAARCSTTEIVQCLKIVSDNRVHGTERLSPDSIGELVAAHTVTVVNIAVALEEATRELRIDETEAGVATLLARHRFSVSQQQQLIRLAHRLAARAPEQVLIDEELDNAASGRDVLRVLARRIDTLPVLPSTE